MDNNKKFWERVAKLYKTLQEKPFIKIYKEVFKHCDKYLSKDSKVLELACGSGQYTFSLYDKCASWEATDFSGKMIDEAKKRYKKIQSDKSKTNSNSQLESKLNFSVEDATSLSFPDESFDVVLIANALHIMPNPDKALMEIKRVLKKDGVLIAPTFVYDIPMGKLRAWIVETAGFKSFYKWTSSEYESFVKNSGYEILENTLFLPECFLVCKKN